MRACAFSSHNVKLRCVTRHGGSRDPAPLTVSRRCLTSLPLRNTILSKALSRSVTQRRASARSSRFSAPRCTHSRASAARNIVSHARRFCQSRQNGGPRNSSNPTPGLAVEPRALHRPSRKFGLCAPAGLTAQRVARLAYFRENRSVSESRGGTPHAQGALGTELT